MLSCVHKEAHLSIVAIVPEFPLVVFLLHDMLFPEDISTCRSFVRRLGAYGSRVNLNAIRRDTYTEGRR
jgi:hypothetical protein